MIAQNVESLKYSLPISPVAFVDFIAFLVMHAKGEIPKKCGNWRRLHPKNGALFSAIIGANFYALERTPWKR
jgi:hypothetical protein